MGFEGYRCLSSHPFVAPDENRPSLLLRHTAGLLLGPSIFAGGGRFYVGLRAGLTVAASIPIAVLSISISRVRTRFNSENNIVQDDRQRLPASPLHRELFLHCPR